MANSSMKIVINNKDVLRTFGDNRVLVMEYIFEHFEKSLPELLEMYPSIKFGDNVDIIYRKGRKKNKKYIKMNLIRGVKI